MEQPLLFSGRFGLHDHNDGVDEMMSTEMFDLIRWRNAMTQLRRCSCFDSPSAPISPNCAANFTAGAFVRAVDRLGYDETDKLISQLSEAPKLGHELQSYIDQMAPIMESVNEGLAIFGSDLKNWPLLDLAERRPPPQPTEARPRKVRKNKHDLPDRHESLYKMVYAMAVDRYGFDPRAKYQHTTSKISDATERQGCRVSADTIKQILKEAELFVEQQPE